jgi:hypothetical protein
MKEKMSPPSAEKSKTPPFVSHRVRANSENAEKSRLTSDNHAFYVGKYIPKGVGKKIVEFATGNYKDRIYSEEFYLAMLQSAFAEVADGEDVQIVIAPQFSEIFNGQQDVKKAMTVDQQKTFIQKIAKRHFKKVNISIESMEDQELHQPLFQALRSAIDPESNQVDIEKAYGGNEKLELSDKPDSLEIARYLYAVQKEYEKLEMVFKHAVPGQLREEMDDDSPMRYYALTEVAVRLADILDGRHVQGGVDRQEVYDHIIEKIIRGKKGSYKKSPQMQRLFEVMEGQSFETVHLRTQENPYTKKRRSIARKTRFGLITALGITAGAVAFHSGVKHAEKERQRLEELVNGTLRQRLAGKTFFMEGKWEHPKEYNVDIFKGIIQKCLYDIEERYGIDSRYRSKIEPLLQEYLLEHEDPTSMYDDTFRRFDAVDRFVKKHTLYLHSLGLEVNQPYAGLAGHIETFKEALKNNKEVTYSCKAEKPNMIGPSGRVIGEKYPKELTFLGFFRSAQGFGDYDFFILEKEGKKTLVARDEWVQPFDEKRQDFTTERAREGVRQFLYAMQRYNAIGLSFQGRHVRNIELWEEFFETSPCKGEKQEVKHIENFKHLYPEWGHFNDPFGEFGYEYIVQPVFSGKKGVDADCLLARQEGDSHYTYTRAREMIAEYEAIQDKRIDYAHGRYYEAEMPLDLEAKRKEGEVMANEVSGWWKGTEETDYCLTEGIINGYELLVTDYQQELRRLIESHDYSYAATKTILERLETMEEIRDRLEKEVGKNCPTITSSAE